MKDLKINDKITFGNYYGEPLEWIVLDIKDDNALIITSDIVDCIPFGVKDTNYKDSKIRYFLNNKFIDKAFKDEEKMFINKICLEDIECVNDYVFLLSMNEAKKYLTTKELRYASCNHHAIINGGNERSSGHAYWLRTFDENNFVYYIDETCYISSHFINAKYCLRPACWIKIK